MDSQVDPELDDERRKYYRLTDFGLRVLQVEVSRLDSLVRQAQLKHLQPQTGEGGVP